jgi:hypothetical protein
MRVAVRSLRTSLLHSIKHHLVRVEKPAQAFRVLRDDWYLYWRYEEQKLLAVLNVCNVLKIEAPTGSGLSSATVIPGPRDLRD